MDIHANSRLRRTSAIIMVLLLLLMSAPAGFAAPGADRQLTGVYSTTSAYSPSEEKVLVVYQDYNDFALASALKGQFLDTEGRKIGGDFTIATLSLNMPENPHVIYNPAEDQFLVVWNDGISTARRIHGVVLDMNGKKVTDIATFDTEPGLNESHDTPKAAYSEESGMYLITWNMRDDFETQLTGVMVDSLLTTPVEVVYGPFDADLDSFDVLYNPLESVFNVTVEFGGSDPIIAVLEVSEAGQVQMQDAVVPGLTDLSEPRMVYSDFEGDMYAIWVRDTGSKYALFGKFVHENSSLVEFTSNILDEPNTLDVTVNSDTGNILVVWTEDVGGEGALYAQALTSEGALIEDDPVLLEKEAGYITDISVTYTPVEGNYVIAYTLNASLDNPELSVSVYPIDEALDMTTVSELESNQNITDTAADLSDQLKDETQPLVIEDAQKAFKVLEANIDNIENEALLVPALNTYINTAGALETAVKDPANTEFVEKKLVEMTEVLSKSVQKIEDTQTLTKVTSDFLGNIETVQASGAQKTVEMNVTVSDFAKSVIGKIGEVKPTSDVVMNAEKAQVKFDPASLETEIEKTKTAYEAVTGAFDAYYGSENVRQFDMEVTLKSDRVADKVQVPLSADLVEKFKNAGVGKVGVKVGGTKLKVEKDVFDAPLGAGDEIVVDMGFEDQTFTAQQEALTFKSGYTTDVEILVGGEEKKVLDEPVELAFDLGQFEFFDEQYNPSRVSVFKLNEETGVWEPVGGVYDPVTNTVSTNRISLSQYTVMQSNKSFNDVESSWAKAEINELLGKGIIDEEETFNPEDAVTREEFTVWVTRAYGLTNEEAAAPFEDIDLASGHYDEIASAYDKGIISGNSETTFNPDGNITKEQMMVILSNAMVAYDDKKLNEDLTAQITDYRDGTEVADWATDEVALMIELGIITVGERGIGPQETISKEMAASIIKKIYG